MHRDEALQTVDMGEMYAFVKELCVTLSTVCFLYSVVLNITRHTTKDDKSILDTFQDLALNSSIIAVGWVLHDHCHNEELCIVGCSMKCEAPYVTPLCRLMRGDT